MGSGASRHLLPCLRPSVAGGGDGGASFDPGPLDETLGHSFCYVRSSSPALSRSSSASSSVAAETSFKAISGASVSANSSAPLPVFDNSSVARSAFRSSSSFSSLPLQLSSSGGAAASGPLDRGFFLSGPIERGALSGPLDSSSAVPFSGPIVKKRRRGIPGIPGRIRKPSLLRRSLSEKNRPWVVPLRSFPNRSSDTDDAPSGGGSVQWAHGKAGEDRVHVVVSEHRWLFIGIYDGFNGPDAPEFLVGNLYRSVFNELRGLFWEEVEEEEIKKEATFREEDSKVGRPLWELLEESEEDRGLEFSGSGRFAVSLSKLRYGFGSWRKEGGRMRFPRWRFDWDEKAKVIQEVPERSSGRRRRKAGPVADHELVLRALSRALEVTELAYLEMTDRAMDCNPELALMGSCLLVALMRDDDVYVMNVGDSRAIVAQHRQQGAVEGRVGGGLEEGCVQEVGGGVEGNGDGVEIEAPRRGAMELGALQLSTDHSTSIAEVRFYRLEHKSDEFNCMVLQLVFRNILIDLALFEELCEWGPRIYI